MDKNQALGQENRLTPLAVIAKNSLAVLAARVIEVVCALIVVALIARYLGVDLYGLYGYITSIIAIVIVFSYFGMQRIIIREIAKDKTLIRKYLGAGIILRGILSLGTLGFIFLVTQFIDLDPKSVAALYIFGLSEIPASFISLLTSIFTAIEKMGYETLFTAISRILNLLLISLAITFDMGFTGLFMALLIGNLISLGLVIKFTVARIGWPEFELNPRLWKFILKESFPLMLTSFLAKTLFRVDVFVLKFFKSLSDVSLFFGPHSIILRLRIIPLTLSIALFPSLSRIAEHSEESLINVFEKALKILISISIPMSIIAVALADDLIILCLGKAFAEAAIVFKILIWTINFMFVECLMGFVLLSLSKQWFTTLSHAITLLVNLVLDIILIPKYGFIGASVATLIAYGLRTTISYIFVSINTRFLVLHKIVLKPFLAALLMGGVLLWGSKADNLYFSCVIASLLYVVVLWRSKNFSLEEIAAFKRVWQRG